MRTVLFVVLFFLSSACYHHAEILEEFCRECGILPWSYINEGLPPSQECLERCNNDDFISPRRLKRDASEEMDIVFVIDTSVNCDGYHFQMAKAFSIQFSELVLIDPDNVQIGLIKYSTDVYEQYPLSLYKNRKQIQEATSGLNKRGVTAVKTRTDLAIKAAVNMFKKSGRSGAKRIVIVFTVGNSPNSKATKSAADYARKNKISVYAVANCYPTKSGLEEIAAIGGTHSVPFTMASVTDLIQATDVQVTSSIGTDPKTQADVIFIVDTSVDPEDVELEKTFIANVVKLLNVNSKNIHVGVYSFSLESSSLKEVVGLTQGVSRGKIISAVRGIKRNGIRKQVKNYAEAIEGMTAIFKKYGRKGAQSVGVLISNGLIPGDVKESEKVKLRMQAADAVKTAEKDPYRIFTYVVSIGQVLNTKTLVLLSRCPSRHIKVADVTKMAQNIDALGQTL